MPFGIVDRFNERKIDRMREEISEGNMRIAELEAVLARIANGEIDEGGHRRNHPNATAMARKALGLAT